MSRDTKSPSAPEIYQHAAEIPVESARKAYLDAVCGQDTELRERVEKLLAARNENRDNLLQRATPNFAEEGSFAENGEIDTGETNLSNPEAMGISETDDESIRGLIDVSQHPLIGHYKLLEEIGHGGMGTVYMAEQTEPVTRRVALKVIKPGMDTKEVIARFEAERQALALMDHAHIAKVLDGGTTDEGRPYFVMELVRGVSITEFCKQKKLPLQERLELFIDICKAVQHAHQKGIIHRDLKPSNLLVTMHDHLPVVKVIDFGVAKALNQKLTGRTLFTQFSQMVGTPLYMAPEQAQMSGLDVDTRSDIYSLGVILYELLTETTPFDKETMSSLGVDGIRKLINEQEPQRPSARLSTMKVDNGPTIDDERTLDAEDVAKQLKRELDWIVMKALEKDRERRYESANAFAADVQRYLNDEPVEACPPTLSYRLKKYAKKHKAWLTTAALLIVMLMTSTAVSGVFAYQANEAKKEAEEQKAEAVEAKDLADERLVAEQKARQRAKQQEEKATRNLQAALDAVDKLLTHVSSDELGQIPQVQAIRKDILQDTLKFYEKFTSEVGDSPELQAKAATTWSTLADLGGQLLERDVWQRADEKAVTIAEKLAHQPNATEIDLERFAKLAKKAGTRTVNIKARHSSEIGAEYCLKAEAAYRELHEQHPDNKEYRIELARLCMSKHVNVPSRQDPILRRKKYKTEAMELLEPIPRSEWGFGLVNSFAYDFRTNKPELRDEWFGILLDQARQDYAEEKSRSTRHNLARALTWMTRFTTRAGTLDAEPYFKEAIPLRIEEYEEFPHNRQRQSGDRYGSELGVLDYANLLASHDRMDEAEQLFTDVLDRFPRNAPLQVDRFRFLRKHGRLEEAEELIKSAIERMPEEWILHEMFASYLNGNADREQALADLSDQIERFPDVSCYYRYRGANKRDAGDHQAALIDFNRAVERFENTGEPAQFLVFMSRGDLLFKMGRYPEALVDYSMVADEVIPYPHALKRRAAAYFHLGQYDKALADLQQNFLISPPDTSILTWIDPQLVAACADETFRTGILKLADQFVEHPRSRGARTARAAILVAFEQHDKALEDLMVVSGSDKPGYYPLYQAALLSFHVGETAQYQKLCDRLLKDFAESDVNTETHFTAWTCALAPDALDDYEPAIKLARHAVEQEPNNQQYLDGLGAILMRAGKYDEAKDQLEKALKAGENDNTSSSYIHYFLAMTEHHLGNANVANEHLTKANESADKELADSPVWNRKLTLELLRNEAEAMIDTKEEPSNNDDDDNSENNSQ